MPIFEPKTIVKDFVLEDAKEAYRASKRLEQFRVSDKAIFFPAFPGTEYIPFSALKDLKVRNTAISVAGTCGKQIPMTRVRMIWGEGKDELRDFMFEKYKSAEKLLEYVKADRPEFEPDILIIPENHF